jgi:hypothetical protein
MSHVIKFEGAMKKDFHPLHRITHIDLSDEASAPEGGVWNSANENQGRGPAEKVPPNREEAKGAGVMLAVTIGSLLAAALVHWWSS